MLIKSIVKLFHCYIVFCSTRFSAIKPRQTWLKQFNNVAIVLVVFFLSSLIFAVPVKAAVSSCSSYINPVVANISTSPNLTFTVDNPSAQTIVWVKFTAPSSNFTVTSASATGWSVTTSSSTATFTSGSIAAQGSGLLTVATTIGSATGSESWTVAVSDSTDGSSATTCGGSTSITVVSTDESSPTLSDLTVSDISDTSAKISWTTNENTTSTVNYGKTIDYGSSTAISLGVSHSVTISGLTANTTYHFNIIYSDPAGNEEETGDNTFTTAKQTTTITKTETKTETKLVSPTPTPTPLPDRTPPLLSIATDLSIPYETAPEISGSTTDAKSAIARIEYSTDDGRIWAEVYTANVAVKSLPLSVSFKFTPSLSDDGNYNLKVRATDSSNNIGVSKTHTLIIDRLPPRVGGNFVFFGPQVLQADRYGSLVTLAGLDQRITLSAVGGPTTIDIVSEGDLDNKSKTQMFSLVKNPDNGLWVGTLAFSKDGLFQLKAKAIDGVGKKTQRNLNSVIVLSPGIVNSQETKKPIVGAKVTLFYQEPTSKVWMVWDAKPFGQTNPQYTKANGLYKLFVPSGMYYLKIEAKGFAALTTSLFRIDKPSPINSNFELKMGKFFKLGPFSITLPDFSTSRVPVRLSGPEIRKNERDLGLLDKEAPLFELLTTGGSTFDILKLRGRPSMITFVTTWSPPAVEQLSVLEKVAKDGSIRSVAVSTQESLSQLTMFQKRGGYTIPIVVDPDGTLVENYKLTSLPMHYFLDRYGVVKKVVSGVLNEAEIKDAIASIRKF